MTHTWDVNQTIIWTVEGKTAKFHYQSVTQIKEAPGDDHSLVGVWYDRPVKTLSIEGQAWTVEQDPQPQKDGWPELIQVDTLGIIEPYFKVGSGPDAYPYDCDSKIKYPDAIIYFDKFNSWIGSYRLEKDPIENYYNVIPHWRGRV